MKKVIKRLGLAVLMISLLFGLAKTDVAASGEYEAPTSTEAKGKKDIKLKLITLADEEKYLIPGATYKIKYKVKPQNATNKEVKYSSSNKKIATVDKDGKVRALKKGTVTITVKAADGSKKKAKIKIHVVKKIKKLKTDKSVKHIQIGMSWTNKVKYKNKVVNDRPLKYSSSNPSVARVDKTGKVTGRKVGKAVITIQAEDTSKVKAQYTVFVVKSVLDKKTICLDSFSQCQLTALNDGDSVKWSSSDESIAVVDTEGMVTALEPGKATITADIKGDVYSCKVEVLSKVSPIGEFLYDFEIIQEKGMSDHTFIGNDLYCINASNDTHTKYAPVWVYSVDFKNQLVTTQKLIKHNLGHANTIDYSEENDALVFGNGSADSSLKGHFYILTSPAERETWNIADCIDFDLTKLDWGIKTQAVWGEEPDIVYIITDENRFVRKLKLGRDENHNFDGTYELLRVWYTEEMYDCNQGTVFYKGKLYAGIGHSQLEVLETQLNEDGTMTQTLYKDPIYKSDGQCLKEPYTEGITIRDGLLYLGGNDRKIRVYKLPENDNADAGGKQ